MGLIFRKLRSGLNRIYTRLYAAINGISVGPYTVIEPGAIVKRVNGGSITLGKYCQISRGAMILSYGGVMHFGDYCSINPYTVVYGHGGLKIGNFVRIAAHTTIVPANHVFASRDKPIAMQGMQLQGISIADDVWIGSGVRMLDGTSVERGVVIAAGAVVRGSLREFGIYGGVPAKLLRFRP